MATIRERSGKLDCRLSLHGHSLQRNNNLEDNAYNRRILKNVSNSLRQKSHWALLNTKSIFQKVNVSMILRKKKSANRCTN